MLRGMLVEYYGEGFRCGGAGADIMSRVAQNELEPRFTRDACG